MENLTKKEKELVAIGTALGSNCVPCIIYHIKESKRLGITNKQIKEAVAISDKVKKVPSDNVFNAAYAQLKENAQSGSSYLSRPLRFRNFSKPDFEILLNLAF